MQDLCLTCEPACLSDYPVGKSCADGYQQIALAYSEIGSLGPVHSDHTGIQLVCTVEASLTHECIAYRRFNPVSELRKLGACTGYNSSAARINVWLL